MFVPLCYNCQWQSKCCPFILLLVYQNIFLDSVLVPVMTLKGMSVTEIIIYNLHTWLSLCLLNHTVYVSPTILPTCPWITIRPNWQLHPELRRTVSVPGSVKSLPLSLINDALKDKCATYSMECISASDSIIVMTVKSLFLSLINDVLKDNCATYHDGRY